MSDTGRDQGRHPGGREDWPEGPWQVLAYLFSMIVEKVLGSWTKTLQLCMLGALPVLLVFGSAAFVLGAVRLSSQSLGVIGGSILAAATGMPATLGVIRYVRNRRITSGGDTRPPGDGTTPTAQE